MSVPPHIADTAFRLALATDLVGEDPTPSQVRAFARQAGCAPDILAACLGRRYGNLGGRPHARRVVGPFHPEHNAHLIPVSDGAQAILDDFWRVPA